MFQLGAQAPFRKVQFSAVVTFCRLEGEGHFIIPLSGCILHVWRSCFFHSVTSFRFMCRAVTLSANCPGSTLLEKNNLRWSVEVLNGAEGKQRIPLPLKQPWATAIMHRISLGWFMCQNTDEAAFHIPLLYKESFTLLSPRKGPPHSLPFISVLLPKFPW